MKALKGAFFDDFFKGVLRLKLRRSTNEENLLIYIFRNNFKRN